LCGEPRSLVHYTGRPSSDWRTKTLRELPIATLECDQRRCRRAIVRVEIFDLNCLYPRRGRQLTNGSSWEVRASTHSRIRAHPVVGPPQLPCRSAAAAAGPKNTRREQIRGCLPWGMVWQSVSTLRRESESCAPMPRHRVDHSTASDTLASQPLDSAEVTDDGVGRRPADRGLRSDGGPDASLDRRHQHARLGDPVNAAAARSRWPPTRIHRRGWRRTRVRTLAPNDQRPDLRKSADDARYAATIDWLAVSRSSSRSSARRTPIRWPGRQLRRWPVCSRCRVPCPTPRGRRRSSAIRVRWSGRGLASIDRHHAAF